MARPHRQPARRQSRFVTASASPSVAPQPQENSLIRRHGRSPTVRTSRRVWPAPASWSSAATCTARSPARRRRPRPLVRPRLNGTAPSPSCGSGTAAGRASVDAEAASSRLRLSLGDSRRPNPASHPPVQRLPMPGQQSEVDASRYSLGLTVRGRCTPPAAPRHHDPGEPCPQRLRDQAAEGICPASSRLSCRVSSRRRRAAGRGSR
jgi:hypothetical protein